MPKIKFLNDGKWVDDQSKPVFEVKAGDVLDVSHRLAGFAVEGGAAEYHIESKGVDAVGPESKDDEAGPAKKAEGEPEAKKRRGRPPKDKADSTTE